MYTEENIRGRFPLRDVLLKIMIVIIFIILILFVIAKVMGPSNNRERKNGDYDVVFNENLEAMETFAYTYFTEDRLPKEIEDSAELTLREAFNLNLMDSFTDADGKACDVNESYIRLTKNEDDYTLRVNLKCNEQEDYLLTKVNTYDYCENTICEKDSSKEKAENEEEEVTPEVDITEDNQETPVVNSETPTYSNTETIPNVNDNNADNIVTPPVEPEKTVMYEYRKVTAPILSNWSSWSSWQLNSNGYTAVKCTTTDTTCLKEIQLFSRREPVGVDSTTGQTVTDIVTYYSVRTRSILKEESTDLKWSTYNDTSLLNDGYTYTGNKR